MKEKMSLGCKLLNLVVDGEQAKGIPFGHIINIVGDKSSGKSFLACEIIATNYRKYKDKLKWVYDDCESGFTFDTEKLYGIKIKNDKVKSRTVEELFCNCKTFLESLKKDEYGIYVVDSLDGLSSYELQEMSEERVKAFKQGKEFDKGSYQMGIPKFLSQEFFKNLAGEFYEKRAVLIVISQVRENINPFSFEKYSRSGGKALDFYSHTVLWLATGKKIKVKDRTIGVVIKAKTTKSKTPYPFRECMFSLLFDYGIDDIGSCIDFIYDLRTEAGELKKKTEIEWKGTVFNRESLIEFIEGNPNEYKDLLKLTEQEWKKIEQEAKLNRKKIFLED